MDDVATAPASRPMITDMIDSLAIHDAPEPAVVVLRQVVQEAEQAGSLVESKGVV